jgi:hypothetical protein
MSTPYTPPAISTGDKENGGKFASNTGHWRHGSRAGNRADQGGKQ